MENREMKNLELNDDTLDTVSGGADLDEIRTKCTQLGIDFDALYADYEENPSKASIVGKLLSDLWVNGHSRFGNTEIVDALREKYPLAP